MKDLAVIIVSYNTKEITQKCLKALYKSLKLTPNLKTEIIVADNASSDGSVSVLKKFKTPAGNIEYKLIENSKNVGFAEANNEALAISNSKYVLFLNSDAIVKEANFEDLVYYMNKNKKVGALTVRIRLEDGSIDWASHRGSPTVWRSFTYFSKLEKLSCKIPPLAKHFGGYHLRHLDMNTIHEIDSPSGAFYMTRKSILDDIGPFDKRFFMYGEDLDLSHRIKQAGYIIVYYPLFTVEHLKYKSGLKRGIPSTEQKTRKHFDDAMKIFYDKHFAHKNPKIINKTVHFFINLRQKLS